MNSVRAALPPLPHLPPGEPPPRPTASGPPADVWQVLFTSEMRVGVTKRHLRACTKPTANCDFDAPPNVGLFTRHEVVDPNSYVGLNINRKLPNPLWVPACH